MLASCVYSNGLSNDDRMDYYYFLNFLTWFFPNKGGNNDRWCAFQKHGRSYLLHGVSALRRRPLSLQSLPHSLVVHSQLSMSVVRTVSVIVARMGLVTGTKNHF